MAAQEGSLLLEPAQGAPASASRPASWRKRLILTVGVGLGIAGGVLFMKPGGTGQTGAPIPQLPHVTSLLQVGERSGAGTLLTPPEASTEAPPNARCAWERAAVDGSVCEADDEQSSLTTSTAYYYKHKHPRQCSEFKQVWACTQGRERTVLAGPFSSSAQQWHFLSLPFELLNDGDRIVRVVGDTVNASDAQSPIAYPPLHMHHIHIQHEIPHWFETHGDYHRDPKRGYELQMPKGSCVIYSHLERPEGADTRGIEKAMDAVSVVAHVNDVRGGAALGMGGHRSGSGASLAALRQQLPPYKWYFRVQMELAEDSKPCTRADKLVLQNPSALLGQHDVLGRYNAGNETHVLHWTIRLGVGGKLLPETVRYHSHRARHAGYLLLRGEHTFASLVKSGALPKDFFTRCPGAGCPSLADVRERIEKAAGPSLLCRDDPTVPSMEMVQEDDSVTSARVAQRQFDRPGKIECDAFSFAAGEPVTTFSFAAPISDAQRNVFPQHTMLLAHFTPDLSSKESTDDEGEESVRPAEAGASRAYQFETDAYGFWCPSRGVLQDRIDDQVDRINTHLDSDARGHIESTAKALKTLVASFGEDGYPMDTSVKGATALWEDGVDDVSWAKMVKAAGLGME